MGIWRAAGEWKISPGRGVRTLAGGKSASALAAPGILKKISEPRRGDRKHSISVLHRFLSPLRGSILFCRIPGAAPALRAYPRLVFFHPLRGLKIPRAFSPPNSNLASSVLKLWDTCGTEFEGTDGLMSVQCGSWLLRVSIHLPRRLVRRISGCPGRG